MKYCKTMIKMDTLKDRKTQYKRPENIQMSVFGNGKIFQ